MNKSDAVKRKLYVKFGFTPRELEYFFNGGYMAPEKVAVLDSKLEKHGWDENCTDNKVFWNNVGFSIEYIDAMWEELGMY